MLKATPETPRLYRNFPISIDLAHLTQTTNQIPMGRSGMPAPEARGTVPPIFSSKRVCFVQRSMLGLFPKANSPRRFAPASMPGICSGECNHKQSEPQQPCLPQSVTGHLRPGDLGGGREAETNHSSGRVLNRAHSHAHRHS